MSASDSSRGPAKSGARPSTGAASARSTSRAPTSRTATGCVRPRGATCSGPIFATPHIWRGELVELRGPGDRVRDAAPRRGALLRDLPGIEREGRHTVAADDRERHEVLHASRASVGHERSRDRLVERGRIVLALHAGRVDHDVDPDERIGDSGSADEVDPCRPSQHHDVMPTASGGSHGGRPCLPRAACHGDSHALRTSPVVPIGRALQARAVVVFVVQVGRAPTP